MRRFRAIARAVGVDDRVRLVGAAQRAEVPGVLRSVDVVACCPWYEPFGLVALEAMACGRPVVATAVGGVAETVDDGVTGLLVPPANAGALADAIERLARDVSLRSEMGRAGRAFVEANYRWSDNAALMERLYGSVTRAS